MSKNQLLMPANAVVLSEKDMIEVNGGEKYTFYLNNNDCKALCFAICGTMVGMSASAIVVAADVAAMTVAAFIPGMAGLTGTVLAGVAFEFAKAMTEVCLSETKGLKIVYEYPLDIEFSITGK
ncbi:MAG: hypothetical protein E7262_10045 [Lachnospiraceae bacterium]|nr:hypothetical protein [Lachnospiraceae bacterium]